VRLKGWGGLVQRGGAWPLSTEAARHRRHGRPRAHHHGMDL
jgi:hypothetical protein